MDRTILVRYMDACALVEETEADLARLKEERKDHAVDSVKGSNPNFPYEPRVFRVEGVSYQEYLKPDEQKQIESLLQKRRDAAAMVRVEVDAWLNTIPIRMQRIVRARFMQHKTWEEVRKSLDAASPEAVRMEFERFMKKNRERDAADADDEE